MPSILFVIRSLWQIYATLEVYSQTRLEQTFSKMFPKGPTNLILARGVNLAYSKSFTSALSL